MKTLWLLKGLLVMAERKVRNGVLRNGRKLDPYCVAVELTVEKFSNAVILLKVNHCTLMNFIIS